MRAIPISAITARTSAEIQVDQAMDRDQIRNAFGRMEQDLIGPAEGFLKGHGPVGDGQEPLIGDDDERVDDFPQLLQPLFGPLHALLSFEVKGLGHHGDGQRPDFPGHGRDDRCSAGPRPSTQTGRNEHHVGPHQQFPDPVFVFQGRALAEFGVGARAQSPGQFGPQLDPNGRRTSGQGLRIGVRRDEFNVAQPLLDHRVHGVASASSDTHHLQIRPGATALFEFDHPPTSLCRKWPG
jgi:hypothetical protein